MLQLSLIKCFHNKDKRHGTLSNDLRNVQSEQMHRGPPLLGAPHLTYHEQKKFDCEKLGQIVTKSLCTCCVIT